MARMSLEWFEALVSGMPEGASPNGLERINTVISEKSTALTKALEDARSDVVAVLVDGTVVTVDWLGRKDGT